jgi:hypothetical protein
VRGEQVAFDPVGEEREAALPGLAALHALACAARRCAIQAGKLALDRVDAHRDAGAVERAEPGAACCWRSSAAAGSA